MAFQGKELNLLSPLPPPLLMVSLIFLPIFHNSLNARNLGFPLAVMLDSSAVMAGIEGSVVALEGI